MGWPSGLVEEKKRSIKVRNVRFVQHLSIVDNLRGILYTSC